MSFLETPAVSSLIERAHGGQASHEKNPLLEYELENVCGGNSIQRDFDAMVRTQLMTLPKGEDPDRHAMSHASYILNMIPKYMHNRISLEKYSDYTKNFGKIS